MNKKKKEIYKCYKCSREFTTIRGRASHQRAHPWIAPEPELKPTVSHSLLSGIKLQAGDIFYRVEKWKIKKITKSEGSTTVNTESELVQSNWQSNKPE